MTAPAPGRTESRAASPPPAGTHQARAQQPPAPCATCGVELVSITITVDGNDLVMSSCQRCDVRTWRLAGRPIGLDRALAEVGQHQGRRR
ncbi:MAG: hypothetical protein ACK5RL_18725 [Acidimicrobiales bacterium]